MRPNRSTSAARLMQLSLRRLKRASRVSAYLIGEGAMSGTSARTGRFGADSCGEGNCGEAEEFFNNEETEGTEGEIGIAPDEAHGSDEAVLPQRAPRARRKIGRGGRGYGPRGRPRGRVGWGC